MAKMPPGCAPELAAISGLPAITLPCGVSRIGLPVGMEMLSVQKDEAALMVLALACEGAGREGIDTKSPQSLRSAGFLYFTGHIRIIIWWAGGV